MNEPDENLAQLFVEESETEAQREAFVAAVQRRVARERALANALAIGGAVLLGAAAVALIATVPEVALYPVQQVAGLLSSPAGAVASLLASAGAAWWSRYGDA